MTGRPEHLPLPPAVDAALREFMNALGKSAMYPPGHRFVAEATATLTEKLRVAIGDRDSLTVGVTPRGLLIDGSPFDLLPSIFRQLAGRLHRKNIGTIQVMAGLDRDDVAAMLEAVGSSDAEETVGRTGLRRGTLRIEPLVYDVLAFADSRADPELDEVFWVQLVEAAFGKRLADEDGNPSVPQLVEQINQRVTHEDGARRVFEALTSFASAIVARGDRGTDNARRRLVDILAALSRPTTVRVVEGATSAMARRRFLRDTLQLVPPALLMQLLEVVAEADGEPISPQLRWMLGKLAGEVAGTDRLVGSSFTYQVMGLIEQWDGGTQADYEFGDTRVNLESQRLLAVGLELDLAPIGVTTAAGRMAEKGQLVELFQLLEHPGNHQAVVDTILKRVLDPGLLDRVLHQVPIDFPLVEKIVAQAGRDSVAALIDALGSSEDRSTRRRLLDILVGIGPGAEAALLENLKDAPWFLIRNILVVLGHFSQLQHAEQLLPMLRHEELRVRQEALKVLVKQDGQIRNRVLGEALEDGEPVLLRSALASIGTDCPSRLAAPVAAILASGDEELQLLALRSLSEVQNPLIIPPLLAQVRATRGIFRRTRLLPATPVMLGSLTLLARNFARHRQVSQVLGMAAHSSDPAVRTAVGIQE